MCGWNCARALLFVNKIWWLKRKCSIASGRHGTNYKPSSANAKEILNIFWPLLFVNKICWLKRKCSIASGRHGSNYKPSSAQVPVLIMHNAKEILNVFWPLCCFRTKQWWANQAIYMVKLTTGRHRASMTLCRARYVSITYVGGDSLKSCIMKNDVRLWRLLPANHKSCDRAASRKSATLTCAFNVETRQYLVWTTRHPVLNFTAIISSV